MSGNNGININIDPIALLEWGRVQGAQQQELESRLLLMRQLYAAQRMGHPIPTAVQAYALGSSGGLQIDLLPMRDASVQQIVGALPPNVEPMRSASPAGVTTAPYAAPPPAPKGVPEDVVEAEPLERSGSAVAVVLQYLLGTGVVMLLITMVLGINPLKWLPRLEFGVGKTSQSAPSVSPVSSPSSAPSPAASTKGVGISGQVDQYVHEPAVK
jgi:hypothetical protein